MASGIRLTTEEFIARAREVHGNKYDYSKVEYKNNNTKVCIICPIHGEFWQIPSSHLNGQGCRKCGFLNTAKKRKASTVRFIFKAKIKHGDRYDYSKVEYVNIDTKICIVCPEHGEFWQTPYNHLKGCQCPKCMGKTTTNTAEFIKKALRLHRDRYDYSKVEYKNSQTKVCIICPEHGEFWQTPNSHLRGQGCPICNNGFNKLYKLSLLNKEDLLHMSSHQLLEVIANKKLPSDFKHLAFSPSGSTERCGSIKELIDLYTDTEKTE